MISEGGSRKVFALVAIVRNTTARLQEEPPQLPELPREGSTVEGLASTQSRRSRWHWEGAAAFVTAIAAILGGGIPTMSYLYLMGFYEQWSLRPEQVGLGMGIAIQVGAAILVGFGGVFAFVASITYFYRQSARLSRNEATAAMAGSMLLAWGAKVWLARTESNPLLTAVLVSSAAIAFGIVFRGPDAKTAGGAPEVASSVTAAGAGWWPAIRRHARVITSASLRELRLLAAWLSVSTLLVFSLGVVPVRSYLQGRREGARITAGVFSADESALAALYGRIAEPVTVSWTGQGSGLLKHEAEEAVLLGGRDGTVVIYSLEQCRVFRLPSDYVSIASDVGLRPVGMPPAPTSPGTQRERCARETPATPAITTMKPK